MSERPIINSTEPSKLSAIANIHPNQPTLQPQVNDVRTTVNSGTFGGFKIPEYVKIIIYFAIIFIPICCLMLWFINKGRKVSMMLDKTIQENETLQRELAQLRTQHMAQIRAQNGQRNSGNNDSCCYRKPSTSFKQQNNNNNNFGRSKPSQYQEEPYVEQPNESEIDPTIGNINLIIDTDGNLYTSTGIFFSGPGIETMGNSPKQSDVRIEEITDDDENGTPIDDFEEEGDGNTQLKDVDQSEPLIDNDQEENREVKPDNSQQPQQAQQPQQPQKSIPKMAPKGAPSKK
jgi:hypothetical protein